VRIRLATAADAGAISALVIESARHFVFPEQSPAAVAHLLGWMGPRRSARASRPGTGIMSPKSARRSSVSSIATRDDCHVHLLFVDERFQRRAIARQLWDVALAACRASANPPRRSA